MVALTCSFKLFFALDAIEVPSDTKIHECSQQSLKQDLSATDTTGHMSQLVSSIGAMTLSSKEVVHFSVPSVNDPARSTLSIGYHFTSEDGEFRDENASIHSSHQFDKKIVTRTDDVPQSLNVQSIADTNSSVSRRVSTTDYIYTMLTEDTGPELVPVFPSWNLLCLGPASLYNPQKGIEQQGFFSGSNFLLPWEIRLSENATALLQKEVGNVIKDGGEEQWPAPGEASKSTASNATSAPSGGPGIHLPIFQTAAKLMMLSKELDNHDYKETATKISTPTKQQKGGKDEKSKSSGIKAYIGNEYECPRGHR